MIYEIINPSDACTIESDDQTLASIAVIVLGEGAYGLYDENGDVVLPIFRFSNPDKLVEWLTDRGINSNDMDTFYAKNGETMATILESITYGKVSDRKAILAVCEGKSYEERVAALAKWNDTKRSSMNDISSAAHSLAKVFREKAKSAKSKT